MRTLLALALALAVTLSEGCVNPLALFGPDPTLEVRVDVTERLTQARRGDTTRVRTRQGVDDPKGFAGLQIVISGDDMRTRTYDASHFADYTKPRFKVPAGGYATVTARIIQDGRVVAELSGQWALESKVRWALDIERAPWPAGNGIPDNLDHPGCQWFWCHAVWRSPVAEEAANYADEALWVTLYRVHPNECADVC